MAAARADRRLDLRALPLRRARAARATTPRPSCASGRERLRAMAEGADVYAYFNNDWEALRGAKCASSAPVGGRVRGCASERRARARCCCAVAPCWRFPAASRRRSSTSPSAVEPPRPRTCSRSAARTSSSAGRTTASAAPAAQGPGPVRPLRHAGRRRRGRPRPPRRLRGRGRQLRRDPRRRDRPGRRLHAPPPRVARSREGDRVDTAGRVGDVGQSGDASGCHLHFELWTQPGWYRGGKAYDPLPAAAPLGSALDDRYDGANVVCPTAAGWSSQVARRAHNPKVAGSNPAPAIHQRPCTAGPFCVLSEMPAGRLDTNWLPICSLGHAPFANAARSSSTPRGVCDLSLWWKGWRMTASVTTRCGRRA